MSSTSASTNIGLILSTVFIMIAMSIASPAFRPSKCAVCTDADLAKCPALVPGPDCELIQEPNCGCCKMCAKNVGENCGVATGLCRSGLECIPPPMTSEQYRDYGPANYFMEAAMGEFICVTHEQFIEILTGVAYGDVGDYSDEDGLVIPEIHDPRLDHADGEENNVNVEGDVETISNLKIPELQDLSHLNPFNSESELETPEHKPPQPPIAPFQNAVESCIYHSDQVWGKEHFDHHEWIPSCEKDGSYFPEQCELSFGLERGRCWCVDRLGNPVSKFIAGETASPDICMPEFNKT